MKFRESFRPFAPSVLREEVSDWFEHDEDSPYMLLVTKVREQNVFQYLKRMNFYLGLIS